MSSYTYATILKKAKECKSNVEKNYKLGINEEWGYYFAQSILNPKKTIKRLKFGKAPKPSGSKISRQINENGYKKLAKDLINFVESKGRMRNYLDYKNQRIRTRLYVYMFAKILVYYDEHNKMPLEVNVNYKAFYKPVEPHQVVYDYFVKKTGLKPKQLDDVCDWVIKYVKYLLYFDDQKSNKEVIDSKSGNCTDLLQFLVNMAKALGYDWKVIHTQCKVSKTGHVYGMFRKKGSSNWFIRDIACIADESDYCVWCQVPDKGYKLAENPSWFLENLNR